MSQPQEPKPALLVVSILSSEMSRIWPQVRDRLVQEFGPLDMISDPFAFTETHYYDQELGTPITRRLVSFERLYPQDGLAGIKVVTNTLEDEWRRPDGRRIVNLDPGFVCLERLVLATGKNFTHRIYLGQGIFADLTLIFQKGAWRILPWTFPDYAGAHIQELLTRMRSRYKALCRRGSRHPGTG